MLKIIITDDHPIVRQGITELINSEPSFTITGQFDDGQLLLQSSALVEADILFLDLNMPRTDGLKVLQQIRDKKIKVKTIVLTSYASEKLAAECRKLGASAYLLKTNNIENLILIIKDVMKGETFFETISTPISKEDNQFTYLDGFLQKYRLTKRETQIIKLICTGYSSSDIADKLALSAFTVQTHRKNIFRKLQLENSNTASLYDFASKNGLI
ncbi:response regulator [Flavobacterium rakeshii]|uniref:Response regulator n=1 Tax=Flavobacterium rakeshii TaxID=1038845 RepID=A0A6N8HFT3_9FLAO|nr:response regulator transcription factor [Flavobacterium rakeshii]MUV04540.1 response regulator [Flavobacterium rakeshii]